MPDNIDRCEMSQKSQIILDCLEYEVTEQECEKDRVDSLWTSMKEGIQHAATSVLPKSGEKKHKKLRISRPRVIF